MRLLLSLVSLCFFSGLSGQSRQAIDSFTTLLQQHPTEDSARIELLYRLGYAYWNSGTQKTDSIGREIIKLSQKVDYTRGVGRGHRLISIAHWMAGEYEQAYAAALKALGVAEPLQDLETMEASYTLMGLILDDQKQWAAALKHHHRALDIALQQNDSLRVAKVYNNMAGVYFFQKDWPRCLEMYERSLSIRAANWRPVRYF